jgi:sulfopyruvate decarboxylase subunit beta
VKRADCLRALYPELGDRLVVTIMGATAQELYDLGHRDGFFYLQHAMGLASSIGLGLALNRPEAHVVVLDGDGSVLMNLGGLATLGRYRPRNLTHVVFDNGSLLSTGGFASHTASGRVDLAAIARGAGCPRVHDAQTVFQFMEAIADAFEAGEMTTVVARVEPVGPDRYQMDLALPENAFRFRRAVLAGRPARDTGPSHRAP